MVEESLLLLKEHTTECKVKMFFCFKTCPFFQFMKQITNREIFFEIFLSSPVSQIVPKNVECGTLWGFLNIHSVAKYQTN